MRTQSLYGKKKKKKTQTKSLYCKKEKKKKKFVANEDMISTTKRKKLGVYGKT
jgi:hypothetical protein